MIIVERFLFRGLKTKKNARGGLGLNSEVPPWTVP